MITNDGKELIGKYLLGQVPAYASHISVGCGATPLDSGDPNPVGLATKTVMDFEMDRVPVTSNGFVDDNGVTKLSFTAELPTENRYDITEVALWSAGANNLASNSDSHMIFTFDSELWQTHNTAISSVPFKDVIGDSNGDITATEKVFACSTSNVTLRYGSRTARKEGPRYLNSTILMRGDTSSISGASGSWTASAVSPDTQPTHIHINGINLGISNNSPSDVLKLAFSLIDATALASAGDPDTVKILVEFYRSEITSTSGFAKAEISLAGSVFTGNRYHVVEIPISDLITSQDFTASQIRTCRIFVSVVKSGVPSSDWYLAFDGLRIDNVTSVNPVYKMVGYSVVKIDGTPIIKFQNTNNYIEFRVALGIV